MPNLTLDYPGTFRARTEELRLFTSEATGTLNLSIRFGVLEQYVGEAWKPVDPAEVWGNFNLVKKNGTCNESSAKSLATALAWDGDIGAFDLADSPALGKGVQIVVAPETYQGETKQRVKWLNHYNVEPRGGPMGAEDLDRFQQQYNARFRAIVAEGKPDVPPTPGANAPTGDAVPF